MNFKNPFVLPNKEYKFTLDPIDDYKKQTLHLYNKFTQNKEVLESIKSDLDKVYSDPEVSFYGRDRENDRVKRKTPMSNYLADIVTNEEIIVPSFTTYVNPKKRKSLLGDFTLENMKIRNINKALKKKYRIDKNFPLSQEYDEKQKVDKIIVNSISGSMASKGTVLYNPSGHYTQTSMTRTVTSVTNSLTETMIGGNFMFYTPDSVVNYLATVLYEIDKPSFVKMMKDFNLHEVTAEEALDCVLKSTRRYWKNESAEADIFSMLKMIDGIERSMFIYVNSLYHIRIFNDEFVRMIFNGMILPKTGYKTQDPVKFMEEADEYITTFVKFVLSERIRGTKIDYSRLRGTPLLESLVATTENVYKYLDFLRPFIKAVFVTTVIPPNAVDIKKMLRDEIVLSDTDSTGGSQSKTVEWMTGSNQFNGKSTAIAGLGALFVGGVVEHYLKVLTTNMNIDLTENDLLKMKGEFYWQVFTPTNSTKHYYANTDICEGDVYEEGELELKGVHLIASKTPDYIQKRSIEMMKEINNSVVTNQKIDLVKYIKEVAGIEREIIGKIKKGDSSILKTESIGVESSYKLKGDKSPYVKFHLWQDVFGPDYGLAGNAPLPVSTLSLTTDKPGEFKRFMDSIEGSPLGERFKKFNKQFKKSVMGSIKIPKTLGDSNGIPKELMDFINYTKIVTNNCGVFYEILETLGFFRKGDLLISEMGY